MLVYRSGRNRLSVVEALSDLESRIAALEHADGSAVDVVRSLLIDAGELESGLVDAQCTDEDDASPLTSALGELTCGIADAFVRAWNDDVIPLSSRHGMHRALRAVSEHTAFGTVEVSTPEGFAYYGLFPETYIHAAQEMVRTLVPRRAVVIGIRSIGTTLSAVVDATLRASAIATERLTVRPRGHPFDRQLCLAQALVRRLRERAGRAGTVFVIVDEGPGLSGSSFASVIESLTALGVPDERIAILPSWLADPRSFRSERARRVWPKHRKFVGDFARLWLRSGKLERAFGAKIVADLSAGAWRELFFEPGAGPAIQPQHERRKFLARGRDGEYMLIKCEGLERGVGARRARAERAAAAGFAPGVIGFAHGFLATSWVPGTPLDARDVSPVLLSRAADYLAWVSRCERIGARADPVPLLEMLRVNVEEGLGPRWAARAGVLASGVADLIARAPRVRIDGHMLPHEWVRTPHGFLKTDVASHFDDHFYPGATDVAWDVAATIIELELDAAATESFVREYEAASGDARIWSRLRLLRPAYAAFRLGYCTMGAAALGSAIDGERLRAASRRYAEVLRHELSAHLVDGQSCATGTQVPA